MTPQIHAVWHCEPNESVEHFVLASTNAGWLLRGIVMITIDDEPSEIRYEVTADDLWRTREATIRLGDETIDVAVSDGQWWINDVINDDLMGCIDLDLGWTPATNTLPIRRLGLDVGESAQIHTAWLRYPEMSFVSATQTYSRVSDRIWRYQSGQADYELEVTEGVVCRYGDLWWGSVQAASPGTR
jgi:hypothetical protein